MTKQTRHLTIRTAVALSALTALTLTGCGSNDETTTASSTSTSTTTSSPAAAPSATEAASSSPEAGAIGSATATTTPEAPASAGGDAASKNFTDASLAKVFTGQKLNGKTLQTASSKEMDQVVKAMDSVASAMKASTVQPAACKSATLASSATFPKDAARSMAASGAKDPVLIVRSQSSPEVAQAVVDTWRKTNTACAKYSLTLEQNGQKITVQSTNKASDIPLAVAQDGAGLEGSSTISGKTSKQTAVTGTYGNVVIQAVSGDGSIPLSTLAKAVDESAKLLAADMGK